MAERPKVCRHALPLSPGERAWLELEEEGRAPHWVPGKVIVVEEARVLMQWTDSQGGVVVEGWYDRWRAVPWMGHD